MKRKKPLQRKTPLKRSAFKAKPKSSPKSSSGAATASRKLSSFKKPKPKKDADFYAQWGARQECCHACGIGKELAEFHRFPGLSTHHIAKAGRVHTATNLLRLCQRCHDCAENLDTPLWLPDGSKWYWPKLTFANCHWLKLNRKPGEYDGELLRKLRMGVLAEPVAPHPVYQAEWLARQGRTHEAVSTLAASDFPGTLSDLLNARTQPK